MHCDILANMEELRPKTVASVNREPLNTQTDTGDEIIWIPTDTALRRPETRHSVFRLADVDWAT